MGRSVASNPANVSVESIHFMKCDLKDLLIAVGSVILAGVIAVFSWKPALIVLGIGLLVAVYSVFETRTVFREGDVCPAIVVDSKRKLVAVLADLSKERRPYPVIRILKQPLGRVTGGP